MHSLPIAPDESGDVPRCRAECPSATPSTCGGVCCSECVDCEADQVSTEVGLLCLPRVRELVALAGRRCDGCRRDGNPLTCPDFSGLLGPDGYCSHWEAKP